MMSDGFAFLRGLLLIFIIFSIGNAFSICVHEKDILGSSLVESQLEGHKTYILNDNNQYILYEGQKLIPIKRYHVQEIQNISYPLADYNQYNKKYVEYYRYKRIQDFLAESEVQFQALGYEKVAVGQSIEGRDLYSVRPTQYNPNKKTIVMFGRHHGDEGTANWIIEGFINRFLSAPEDFHSSYQLVLYPMINPDGAEAQTRYNKNSRDLNRSWSFDLSESFDEARIIHQDLKNYLAETKNIVIALDMHGSFTEDFIYRVRKNYVSRDFYNDQQVFIDELAKSDQFQAGNFQATNGHPKMARIVLINSYLLNTLTHETPRDIKLRNSSNRSKSSLMNQGEAVFETILNLY